MKKALSLILALLMVLGLSAWAFADEPAPAPAPAPAPEKHAPVENWPVNVDKLKEIEAADEFPVKITKKVVNDGAGPDGKDILVLTIENGSEDTIVRGAVALLGVDAEGNAFDLLLAERESYRELYEYSASVSLAPGASTFVNIPVDHSSFAGVRAIVTYYGLADYSKVENKTYSELWKFFALGGKTVGSGSEEADALAADAACGLAVAQVIAVENSSGSESNPDRLVFRVENTSEQKVTDMTFGYLGFDENGKYVYIGNADTTPADYHYSDGEPRIATGRTYRISVDPGAAVSVTDTCALKCPHVLAFIKEYITEDGVKHQNPNAAALLQYASAGLYEGTVLD